LKPVDAIIVGGGPAGLATAIAARRKGLHVALIDARKPPIDKTCGEGLLPAAVAALAELGIEIDPHLGFPFAGICLADDTSSVCALIPRGHAMGLRRRVLQNLLIQRAEAEGVSLLWGARISELQFGGVWADAEFHRCRWLVGADGQHSMVRKFIGLDPAKREKFRFGFRQHFAMAPWTDKVEVHWGDRAQVIVTPTAAQEICVVLLTRDPHLRLGPAIERFPEIAKRLQGARAVTRESGAITSLSRARAVVRGNVALVGDASCTVDGISGQGLALAFQEARALGDALASENLAGYQAAHSRITKAPVRITRLLLMMDASATLRRNVLRVLARYPTLFFTLMVLHGGCPEFAQRYKAGLTRVRDAAELSWPAVDA
jgi:2-polyprenyl-6-methoxyphenol hydroxylase-like FAD-dependent oxidoreductase